MLPPYVKYYKSENPGPVVVLMGGTHGDEVCGIEGIKFFMEFFETNPIQKGELYLIINNYKAAELNRRGVDHDINRLFLEELNDNIKGSFEHRRTEELKPILEKADYLLDLHSTSNPSTSFSVALNKTPAHSEILNCLPVEFPSYGWGNKIPGTTMAWVDTHGGVGVAIEAGWLADPKTTKITIDCSKAFLDHLGVFSFTNYTKPSFKQYLQVLDNYLVNDAQSFEYTQEFDNFDRIKPGQLIAIDSKGEYRAGEQEDLVMIFPTVLEKIWAGLMSEAFLLGQFRDLELD